MVVCPKCGELIRYINAAGSVKREGIFIVNPTPHELVSEAGRVIKGFYPHTCKGEMDGKNEGRQASGEERK